jgi:hypothetical protein
MTGKRFMKKVSGGRDTDLGAALMIWAKHYCGQMWRKADGIWTTAQVYRSQGRRNYRTAPTRMIVVQTAQSGSRILFDSECSVAAVNLSHSNPK